MDNPDWDRYRVDSRAAISNQEVRSPVGDPTKWGGSLRIDVPALNALDTFNLVQPGLLRVECLDAYPRPWTMAGTLSAANTANGSIANTWQQGADWAPDFGGAAGPDTVWDVRLIIRMGGGLTSVVHQLSIRRLAEIATSEIGGVGGQSGPYFRLPPSGHPRDIGTPFSMAPWIVNGGLVAKSIAIDVFVSVFAINATPALTFVTQGIIHPIAAGGGL